MVTEILRALSVNRQMTYRKARLDLVQSNELPIIGVSRTRESRLHLRMPSFHITRVVTASFLPYEIHHSYCATDVEL